MDESSEVKVLVLSASNLAGRSIKRKMLHRQTPSLFMALERELWMSSPTPADEDLYQWGRNNHKHPLNPSVYGL